MQEVMTDMKWFKVAQTDKFPKEGGIAVKYQDTEIAVFNFTSQEKWYAISNLCPHKQEMLLSRGMIGDKNGIPKVACPIHKKQFSLESGECLDDSSCGNVKVYPIKVEDDFVFIGVD